MINRFKSLHLLQKVLLILAVLTVLGVIGTFLNSSLQASKTTEIPFGFTWIGTSPDGKETIGNNIEDTNLSVVYSVGMTIIHNKAFPKDDPFQFGGGEWYFKVPANKPFEVVKVDGSTEVARYKNIIAASNSSQFCPEEQKESQVCLSQSIVYLLTADHQQITLQTGPHTFAVINP